MRVGSIRRRQFRLYLARALVSIRLISNGFFTKLWLISAYGASKYNGTNITRGRPHQLAHHTVIQSPFGLSAQRDQIYHQEVK